MKIKDDISSRGHEFIFFFLLSTATTGHENNGYTLIYKTRPFCCDLPNVFFNPPMFLVVKCATLLCHEQHELSLSFG